MGINKPIDTAGSLESARLAEYERLEEYFRSGALTPAQADLLMQKDQSFADWLRARASTRLGS